MTFVRTIQQMFQISLLSKMLVGGSAEQEEAIWLRGRYTRMAVLHFLSGYHEYLAPGKGVDEEAASRNIEAWLTELMLCEVEEQTRWTKPKVLTAAHRLTADVVAALKAAGVPMGAAGR